jgi:hypothetical protein
MLSIIDVIYKYNHMKYYNNGLELKYLIDKLFDHKKSERLNKISMILALRLSFSMKFLLIAIDSL